MNMTLIAFLLMVAGIGFAAGAIAYLIVSIVVLKSIKDILEIGEDGQTEI